MTPKEKADQLIEKYYDLQVSSEETTTYYWCYAKRCSLITVDEIIKSTGLETTYEDDEGKFHDFGLFWQEVKQEIEKL